MIFYRLSYCFLDFLISDRICHLPEAEAGEGWAFAEVGSLYLEMHPFYGRFHLYHVFHCHHQFVWKHHYIWKYIPYYIPYNYNNHRIVLPMGNGLFIAFSSLLASTSLLATIIIIFTVFCIVLPMGTGNMIVLLCSAEMLFNVWRYRSWNKFWIYIWSWIELQIETNCK